MMILLNIQVKNGELKIKIIYFYNTFKYYKMDSLIDPLKDLSQFLAQIGYQYPTNDERRDRLLKAIWENNVSEVQKFFATENLPEQYNLVFRPDREAMPAMKLTISKNYLEIAKILLSTNFYDTLDLKQLITYAMNELYNAPIMDETKIKILDLILAQNGIGNKYFKILNDPEASLSLTVSAELPYAIRKSIRDKNLDKFIRYYQKYPNFVNSIEKIILNDIIYYNTLDIFKFLLLNHFNPVHFQNVFRKALASNNNDIINIMVDIRGILENLLELNPPILLPKYLYDSVWIQIVKAVYGKNANPFLRQENVAAMYPKLSIDDAFKDAPDKVTKNFDLAMEYLIDQVSQKYAPGSVEAEKVLTKLLPNQTIAKELLNNASLIQLCAAINKFENRFDLTERCEDYNISDLIDVLNQLIGQLSRNELDDLISLLRG
jgi:hypothetical protein